jgi:hypothetical protein
MPRTLLRRGLQVAWRAPMNFNFLRVAALAAVMTFALTLSPEPDGSVSGANSAVVVAPAHSAADDPAVVAEAVESVQPKG